MTSTLKIAILCFGIFVAARCSPIEPERPDPVVSEGPGEPEPTDLEPVDPEPENDPQEKPEPAPESPPATFVNYTIHKEMKTAVEASEACKEEGAKLVLLIDWENRPFGNLMAVFDPDYRIVQRLLDAQAAGDDAGEGEPTSWGGWCITANGTYMDINEEQTEEPDKCRYASVKLSNVSGWKLSEMTVGWDNATNKHYFVCSKEVPESELKAALEESQQGSEGAGDEGEDQKEEEIDAEGQGVKDEEHGEVKEGEAEGVKEGDSH